MEAKSCGLIHLFLIACPVYGCNEMKPVQAFIRQDAGYTLDRSLVRGTQKVCFATLCGGNQRQAAVSSSSMMGWCFS